MEVSTVQEWQFFMWALLAGGALALIYDFMRISRRVIATGDIIVNIEDILFCCLVALTMFATAFLKNGGRLRWQGFIGTALGFAAYRIVLRNRIVDGGVFVAGWIAKLVIWILRIVLFPVIIIFKLLRRPIAFVAWYSRRGANRARNAARIQGKRMKQRIKNVKYTIGKK